VPDDEPSTAADLRALGQIAFGWVQLAQQPKSRGRRTKPFPEALSAIVRRLEADPDTPMGDTPSGAEPYRSATELVSDLNRLVATHPCPDADWDALLQQVAENSADGVVPLRRSA
jgi:hypothetical protein